MTKYEAAILAVDKAAESLNDLWLSDAAEYIRERDYLDSIERIAKLYSVPEIILKKQTFWTAKIN